MMMQPPLLVVLLSSLLFLYSVAAAITTPTAAAVAAPQEEEEEEEEDDEPGEDEELVLTDFQRPEAFYDLLGTPYILVSEYNDSSRSKSSTISLLDTTTNARVELTSSTNAMVSPSIFAHSSCTALPFEQLGAHGLDARLIMTTTAELWWEVAVVNHFERESIEFYALNPITRTVTSMGCVDLSASGENHNSVSFGPTSSDRSPTDNLLAATLFFETYYGIKGRLAFYSSFLRPGGGGDGALLLVRAGGSVSVLKDNLNGPNGVWFANDDQIFIAETPNEQVRDVDAETGQYGSAIVSVKASPDNLNRVSDKEFLVTRVDSSFPQIALCNVLGKDAVCKLDFSVLRYNIETLQTEVIYSRKKSGAADSKKTKLPSYSGQPSAAIIKNGFLYIGNYQFNNLLRVKINL
jgi:hypothetical protein